MKKELNVKKIKFICVYLVTETVKGNLGQLLFLFYTIGNINPILPLKWSVHTTQFDWYCPLMELANKTSVLLTGLTVIRQYFWW